jgi:hypothetical protein
LPQFFIPVSKFGRNISLEVLTIVKSSAKPRLDVRPCWRCGSIVKGLSIYVGCWPQWENIHRSNDRPKIWPLLKTRIMQEICGENESFRSMIKDIKKNPSNAIMVTSPITYLVNLSGIPFPVEPALATGILLYIAHIGIDVFCEWSTPAPNT